MSHSTLAPFRIRAYRYQWPADLAASFAFEMENLILAWYVLVETNSVLMLTIYASLHFIGTMFAPIFGVLGDRIGHRKMLWMMRGFYALIAATITGLALSQFINPYIVLVMATLMGLVRPSDIGTRNAVIGEIMPPDQLMGAMGLQRSTQDIARITGALTGAGLAVTLGMGMAYAAVTALYLTSSLLTFFVGYLIGWGSKPSQSPVTTKPAVSPWKEMREGLVYVWRLPHLRSIMLLAFLLNATAFPIFVSLLPYLVREVYQETQTTLGFLTACGAAGALVGSLLISRFNAYFRPGRLMIATSLGWCGAVLVLVQTTEPQIGMVLMFIAGCSQSACLVAIAAVLLRYSDPQYRGRVMGCRILAIYGNLPGLLLFAPILSLIPYAGAASLYALTGIVFTLVIGYHWRTHLWSSNALVNTR